MATNHQSTQIELYSFWKMQKLLQIVWFGNIVYQAYDFLLADFELSDSVLLVNQGLVEVPEELGSVLFLRVVR